MYGLHYTADHEALGLHSPDGDTCLLLHRLAITVNGCRVLAAIQFQTERRPMGRPVQKMSLGVYELSTLVSCIIIPLSEATTVKHSTSL